MSGDQSTPTTPPATGWKVGDAIRVAAEDFKVPSNVADEAAYRLGLDPSMSVERLRADLALAAEIEWEIDTYGDPFLMGVRARVEAGDGMAGRAAVLGEAETEAQR